MKPTELRIGNIVEVNHYGYDDMFASVISINDVGDLCLHLLDERFTKEEYECTMNEVTPIPITEELLEKCGFDEPYDGVYERSCGKFEVTKEGDEWWVSWHGGCDYWFAIKYLHDLQNAYQLVTKQELTLQLCNEK